MATPIFDRSMFQVPGVDPAQVAGGIYNLRGLGPTSPDQSSVAAKPLQVGYTPQTIAPSRNYQQELAEIDARIEASNAINDQNSALLLNQQRQNLIAEAKAVGVDLAPPVAVGVEAEPEAKAPRPVDRDLKAEDLKLLNAKAQDAAVQAVARGEVPKAEAQRAETDAQATVAAVTENIETEDDFSKLLEALGPKDIDYSNWKKEAKELLGVSDNEADVPDWAAPMFLFGLSLMKGPVSSKTGQQGLGGLLADIGAAGQEGFKAFATERARKAAQRQSVANLALQLETRDLARQSSMIELYKANQSAKLDLSAKVGTAYDGITANILGLSTNADDKARGIAGIFTALGDLRAAGVTDQGLLDPQIKAFVTNYAMQEMGVVSVAPLKQIQYAGIDYTYDDRAVANAVKTHNKGRSKTDPKYLNSPLELIGNVINQAEGFDQYQGLVLGARAPDSEIQKETINGLTTLFLLDKTAMNQWMVENPDASEEEKKAAAATWRVAIDNWREDAGKQVSVNIGGIDYFYDEISANEAVKALNKGKKVGDSDYIHGNMGLIGRIITNDPLTTDYDGLVIGDRKPDATWSTFAREDDNGNKVTDLIVTSPSAFKDWKADFQKENGRPAQPADITAAIKEGDAPFRMVVGSQLTDNAEMKSHTFTDEKGVKQTYFFNDAAFAARRRSDKNLTVQDVFANPEKYPKIIGGNVQDYSNLQPNMKTTTIYDGNEKFTFVYDERRMIEGFDDGTISQENAITDMIKQNIGRKVGRGSDIQPLETMWVMDSDGSVISVQAKDAEGVVAAFSTKKAAEDYKKRTTSIIQLNSVLWDVREALYGDAPDDALTTASRLTDWLSTGASLARLVKSRLTTVSPTQATALLDSNSISKETRDVFNQAFSEFDNPNMEMGNKLIDDGAVRSEVKSMMMTLAFSLASAREGGKLTDNDIRNALLTLGWDGTSWGQTPEQMLASMKRAAQVANNQYAMDTVFRMGPDAKKTYQEAIGKKEREGIVETLLRDAASALDERAGAMYAAFANDPTGTLRFDYTERDRVSGQQPGSGVRPELVPVGESFTISAPRDLNNLGPFKPDILKINIPNRFRVLHNALLQTGDGGTFNPPDSLVEIGNRGKDLIKMYVDTPEEAKERFGMSKEQFRELFDEYIGSPGSFLRQYLRPVR